MAAKGIVGRCCGALVIFDFGDGWVKVRDWLNFVFVLYGPCEERLCLDLLDLPIFVCIGEPTVG